MQRRGICLVDALHRCSCIRVVYTFKVCSAAVQGHVSRECASQVLMFEGNSNFQRVDQEASSQQTTLDPCMNLQQSMHMFSSPAFSGPAPPVDHGGFLAKAYASGAPAPTSNTSPAKPPTASTLFHGFPFGGTAPTST
eukprot:509106-Pelagomonas_calceolata.AAC.1